MNTIFFLILRQMRWPLLTLVVVYSITILGLVLIPGQDAEGNPWQMGIFHAFYFTSFMSTTIGFGEIPYEFTDAQRAWITLCIYFTVVAWLYAIGTILNLLKNAVLQDRIQQNIFENKIRNLREPFYILCGYGETGRELTEVLTNHGHHVVVIEQNKKRIEQLKLENLRDFVPALHADARKPDYLISAGLELDYCSGIIALTNNNETNLKIALSARLINPQVKIVCRADAEDVENNLKSFLNYDVPDYNQKDHIIDPFELFARHLNRALNKPAMYSLHRWLTSKTDAKMTENIVPPKRGHWIIGGYGRFGKAVYERLVKNDISVTVMEATPDKTGTPKQQGVVKGWGTDEETLIAADIQQAVGLVAGTNNDTNNLSMILTAKEIKDLFIIARQNFRRNQVLFEKVGADIVMYPSNIVAEEIRVLLATPLLHEFLELAANQSERWICDLLLRIIALSEDDRVPQVEEINLSHQDHCAIRQFLAEGRQIQIKDLMHWEGRPLDCIVLYHEHSFSQRQLLPDLDIVLQAEDKLLICGRREAIRHIYRLLCYPTVLEYNLTGEESHGWLWQKLSSARHIRPSK